MDIRKQFDWQGLLLTPLSDELISRELDENEPAWEYIDGEMVKLGSLAHSSINIEEIQRQALQLFSEKSKDFRLMVHLLRTLQHGSNPAELILAMELLADYIQHYWQTAWPQKPLLKRRLAQQVIKRFDSAQPGFCEQADETQREEAQGALAHLAQCWHTDEPALAKEIDQLRPRYARKPQPKPITAPAEPAETAAQSAGASTSAPIPAVTVDSDGEKAWKQTLLTVADLLCERQPDSPVGYRLRRYAIWHTLTTTPTANGAGKTPLAPASADRTADYLTKLPAADKSLLQQIEQSLTLAPYWLDGHALAAQAAGKLGYTAVADAIRDELRAFLDRLPVLQNLHFSDMSPFISDATLNWLHPPTATTVNSGTAQEQDAIWHCFQQHGLEAALNAAEQHQQQLTEPRDHFYGQLLTAQLLEQAGMSALAQQHYRQLLQAGQHLSLSHWEPGLLAVLAEKAAMTSPSKATTANRSVNP
ncbi:type VI secretion system protein TssA [Photorhabdus antumapuensis]|uniref:type VI secretion system protein TssA n=1 Tax=Photorhabdus antumapuensis TaxID=2862867 RepID=UPI001CEC42D1|nr:type VI secretion system protein TssA [Photorhabdus antumapuensis]MCA6220797.1 type VI secretion system protein TssA [Photorhabdus antumapuensis]